MNPGNGYGDAHYWDVAKRYEVLYARTNKIAPIMAAEYGVSIYTVHRWIREARARGMVFDWSARPQRVYRRCDCEKAESPAMEGVNPCPRT